MTNFCLSAGLAKRMRLETFKRAFRTGKGRMGSIIFIRSRFDFRLVAICSFVEPSIGGWSVGPLLRQRRIFCRGIQIEMAGAGAIGCRLLEKHVCAHGHQSLCGEDPQCPFDFRLLERLRTWRSMACPLRPITTRSSCEKCRHRTAQFAEAGISENERAIQLISLLVEEGWFSNSHMVTWGKTFFCTPEKRRKAIIDAALPDRLQLTIALATGGVTRPQRLQQLSPGRVTHRAQVKHLQVNKVTN